MIATKIGFVRVNEQLPLAIALRSDVTFDDFIITPANKLIVKQLQAFANGNEQFVFLAGPKSCGKTHLIHASCHRIMEQGELPIYLSLDQPQLAPAALQKLELQKFVCLDHIDSVLGYNDWEEALFHFYNRAQENKTKLLLSAATTPPQLDCQLADLKSRLCHGLTLTLTAPNDRDKLHILKLHADKRGMELPYDVSRFLLRHSNRDLTELVNQLDKLDQATLVKQRKLTIPFIKSVLTID